MEAAESMNFITCTILALESTQFYGAGGALGAGGLGLYLLSELRKSSGGAWRVVRDKNETIHRQSWELAKARYERALIEQELLRCRGIKTQTEVTWVQDPGPYVKPTEDELKLW